jgi:hypothetical protein
MQANAYLQKYTKNLYMQQVNLKANDKGLVIQLQGQYLQNICAANSKILLTFRFKQSLFYIIARLR